jgi:hypothetical protein
MATVAVGRNAELPQRSASEAQSVGRDRRESTIPPRQSSLWDDPFAILSVGLGLMFVAGVGTYVAFNAFNRNGQPQPSPTPIETLTPKPTPTVTATPKPTPTETSFSKSLRLVPGKTTIDASTLKAGETLNLNFDGKEGQTLDARLSGEGTLMTLIGPNGEVLDQARRVSFWKGALPFSGAYTMQLRTVQGLEKSAYKLEATLTDVVVPSPSPSPSPSDSPSPSPSPTDTPPPSDAEVKTERVLFSPGQDSTAINGQASEKVVRRYLVDARAGQILSVGVTGGARLSLLYPDGSPVEDATGISQWSGQLPKRGDYIIDVSSNQPSDFQLNVSVK